MLSVVLCDCCKPMNNCRDWAFSNSGWEVGLPAFQLPMFAKCDTLAKGDLLDMFVFRNPFPPFIFGMSIIHSLPEAGSWERQHAPSAPHYGCIMPIPSSQLQQKTNLMQRSKGFCHGVAVSKICYNAVIVLSVVPCDCCKLMNICGESF